MTSEKLLQRVKKVRISDTVVDQIIALIESGQLKVGDQLPGERELVNQLQVGRASVREALRILEAQGVLEVQPGRGTFITSDVTAQSGPESIRIWFSEHGDELRDIIELREALERKAAYLAAERATDAQIAEMRETLEAADECIREQDLDGLQRQDQEFHSLIGLASGNDLLSQLIDGAIESMSHPRRSILRLPKRAHSSHEEHLRILEAVAQHDANAAEKAVSDHIAVVWQSIQSLKDTKAP